MCLLAHGRALYSGPGGHAPVDHLNSQPGLALPPLKAHYNVADYLLEIASDPPAGLFPMSDAFRQSPNLTEPKGNGLSHASTDNIELLERQAGSNYPPSGREIKQKEKRRGYSATFLTQFQVLAGREWKILKRCEILPMFIQFHLNRIC